MRAHNSSLILILGLTLLGLLSACGKIHSRSIKSVTDKYTDQEGYINFGGDEDEDDDFGGPGTGVGTETDTGTGAGTGTGTGTATGFRFKFVGSPTTAQVDGYNIPVYPAVEAQLNGVDYNLYKSGHGVRWKKVAFVTVNVYLATSYVTEPNRNLSANPIAGISASPIEIMSLTLVRDLSGAEITDAMKGSLQANGIDPNDPVYQNIFSQLGSGAKAGEQVLLASYIKNGTIEKVKAVTPTANGSAEGDHVGTDIWRIWFGTPSDSGLSALKPLLVAH